MSPPGIGTGNYGYPTGGKLVVTRTKPVTKKKLPPKKTSTPKTGGGGGGSTAGLTPQQWVAQALRAEMAPLEYTEKARQKRADEARQQSQYATQAIISQLQAQQAPTAALLDAGIAQSKQYATDYANMLKEANPNASIQADLQAIGAPAAQQQQIAAQNQANFGGQGAALFFSQGVIPGASLLANRNAEISHLAGLPAISALQGQQALGRQRALDAQAYSDYVANRMKISAQGPGLLRQVVQDRIAQHNALVNQYQRDAALAQQARALGDKEAYQQAQINLATDRAQLARNRYQTQQNQFAITSGISQQNANTTARNADIAQQRANQAAQAAADKAAAGRIKTEKQRQSFFYSQKAKANTMARQLFNQGRSGGSGSGRFQTDTRPKISRGKAFKILWNQYYPVLNAAKFTRLAIRTMLNKSLDNWYAPAPTHDKQRPKTGAGRPG